MFKSTRTLIALACAFLAFCLSDFAAFASELEPVRLSPNGKHFVLGKSGKPFRVWGVNYDHDSLGEHGRLLEDYWETEWETVKSDFREIKALGANVIRVHLQLGKFMADAETPNRTALARLADLLRLSEELGLYLNITGLGCYHKADTPSWYEVLGETERWNVQARFWRAIAQTCRKSPAVFCYDLMNEPVVDGKKDEGWLGGELGGKFYVQRLTLEKGDRTPAQIVKAWAEQLTATIRAEDPDHLITVGVIPWAMVWPNARDVFYSPGVREAFDFVSIHVYPKSGAVDNALGVLKVYEFGKPVVIEETFPLSCSLDEMDEFLKRSRIRTAGYFSFYWGKTIEEYAEASPTNMAAALTGAWLKHFESRAAEMKRAE